MPVQKLVIKITLKFENCFSNNHQTSHIISYPINCACQISNIFVTLTLSVSMMKAIIELFQVETWSVIHWVASEARTPAAACWPLKMRAPPVDRVLGPAITKLMKSRRSFSFKYKIKINCFHFQFDCDEDMIHQYFILLTYKDNIEQEILITIVLTWQMLELALQTDILQLPAPAASLSR